MSQSVEDGYETVELTDDHLDSIADGERITVDEYTFARNSGLDVDCVITVDDMTKLRYGDGGEITWTPQQVSVVYAGDQDDYSESTMDFSTVDEHHCNTDMKAIDDADRETVTMEVTMDISDMDDTDKEVICELARQYEDSFQEICEKNRDYGFSFLTSGAKLAQSSGTVFENHVRSQVDGLLHRSGDKRERLIENVYGEGSSVVSDEPAVTARENANYYQFMSLVLANPQLAKKASDA